MDAQDTVTVRLYTDGSGGGYQVGYRGYYARAKTLDEALTDLKQQLEAAGVDLPPDPKLVP